MIEGLTNVMTPARQIHAEGGADESIESVALAGAEAIQHIITDRDSLRTRTAAQQRDLVGLSVTNEELRHRLVSIRKNYVELATKILAQLEQFDQLTRDAMRDRRTDAASGEDANLVALAHRLKPGNGLSRSANEAKP